MALTIDIPANIYGVPVASFDEVPKNQRRNNLGEHLYQKAPHGYYFMPVNIGGIELWNPILRMTASKTVAETPLIEQEGSVKEIISIDDYTINIKGIIKRSNGVWPSDELEKLNTFFRRNESLPIRSAMTSIFLKGNENVVITSLDLPENQGHTDSVMYSMEMKSDIDFELIIDE